MSIAKASKQQKKHPAATEQQATEKASSSNRVAATEKASSSNRAAATATKSRYLNASHSSPPFFQGE